MLAITGKGSKTDELQDPKERVAALLGFWDAVDVAGAAEATAIAAPVELATPAVAETVTATAEATVALGTAALMPFMAISTADS